MQIINHLTFVTHYIHCIQCKQALLNAAPFARDFGYGGLHVHADGHVLDGYGTTEGDAHVEQVLDALLTATAPHICHTVQFLVWIGDEMFTQAVGPEFVSPLERVTLA